MHVRTFHLGDVLPDFPRAALAVDGHLHHHHLQTHTHTHESHASMLYHRATHAMHMAVESCDTATKRPACMHVATTTLFVLTR